MTPEEAVHALCAAWDRLDVEALAGLFTEDGIAEDPLLIEAARGRDAVRALYTPSMAELSSCHVEVGHVAVRGDVAFAEGTFASELIDGGGRLDFPFAMVVELRDGRVARLAEYFDTRPLIP